MTNLIFALLLILVQAAMPAQRQTPDNTAGGSTHVPNKSQHDKASTDAAAATGKKGIATTTDDGTIQGDKDRERSVSVSKFPPVTVLPTKKDWADWGYWGFTFALTGGGFLQTWLLFRTLKINALQAKIATHMKDTAERQLRAYVGVSKVYLNLAVVTTPKAFVELENSGQTPAYKVRQWIGISMGPYPFAAPLPKSPNLLNSVAVMSSRVKHASTVAAKPLPFDLVIGTAKTTIVVYGEVIYEDAFGQERHTTYKFIYGGPEGAVNHFKTPNGELAGAMNPDVDGNDAN